MKTSYRLLVPLLLALVATAVPPAAGQTSTTYYRWQDERGRLVVSDRPPQDVGVTYEVVSPYTTMIRRVAPGEGAVPPETEPRPGNDFEQVDTVDENLQVVKKNPENCARAKSNLETLNTTARIRIHDADSGELRYLTEEEKDAQRATAREVIKLHCE